MDPYYAPKIDHSRALIRLKPTSPPSDFDDTTSIYTASTVSPGSSISSRSAHSSTKSQRSHGSASSRSSKSSRSSRSDSDRGSVYSVSSYGSSNTASAYAPVVQYIVSNDAASSYASSASRLSKTSSSSTSKTKSSISLSHTKTPSRHSSCHPSHPTSPTSPYDSRLMAIYLTSLRTHRHLHASTVRRFLHDHQRFASFRPHLAAFSDAAFGLFCEQVRNKNWELVRQIERGEAHPSVDRIVGGVGEEWEDWMPRGRGRVREGERDADGDRVGLKNGWKGHGVREAVFEETWVEGGWRFRRRLEMVE